MSETKVGVLTALIGVVSALVGAAATIAVGSFGYFNKDRELDIQMVNVSLSILRGEATGDKDTLQSRRFALRLLRKYADVDIPEEEFQAWAEKGVTPFAPAGISAFRAPETMSPQSILRLVNFCRENVESGQTGASTNISDENAMLTCIDENYFNFSRGPIPIWDSNN